ncbi:hypothetical protein [Pseudarthrobacter sp. YAF2]|uniref:hypothetical protein n=1 Tax=Pseudarthrobacter sp. YAF2 TaxID=3233078 RepID=UPI003F94DC19
MSSPWRAMRPALLAGAAAVMWLTLSSTAASADAGPDSSSLPGGATGTVLSLANSLSDTVSPPPAGSAAGVTAAPGLAQPVAARISGLADNAIAGVPVLAQVVPPGTVSTVSAPLADVADAATARAVQVVVAPAAEAVPVLEPVLQPVSDLLTGATPVTLPALPVDALPGDLPALVIPDPGVAPPASLETPAAALETASEPGPDSGALLDELGVGDVARLQTAGQAALASMSGHPSVVPASADPDSGQSLPIDPAQLPDQVPSVPASGTGSGGSSGGPSGAAAWLSPFDFGFEHPGAVLAGEASGHIPAPVSFDPGSSPD